MTVFLWSLASYIFIGVIFVSYLNDYFEDAWKELEREDSKFVQLAIQLEANGYNPETLLKITMVLFWPLLLF
jgi:hypothetical protein